MAVPLFQGRLWIKQIELAGGPGHEQEDHVAGFTRKGRLLGRQRVKLRAGFRRATLGREQMGQCRRTEACADIAQEAAACVDSEEVQLVHGHSLVRNSSRFRMIRLRATQAAAPLRSNDSG